LLHPFFPSGFVFSVVRLRDFIVPPASSPPMPAPPAGSPLTRKWSSFFHRMLNGADVWVPVIALASDSPLPFSRFSVL